MLDYAVREKYAKETPIESLLCGCCSFSSSLKGERFSFPFLSCCPVLFQFEGCLRSSLLHRGKIQLWGSTLHTCVHARARVCVCVAVCAAGWPNERVNVCNVYYAWNKHMQKATLPILSPFTRTSKQIPHVVCLYKFMLCAYDKQFSDTRKSICNVQCFK